MNVPWLHPWIRVQLAVRAILTMPWPPGVWPSIKEDISRALAGGLETWRGRSLEERRAWGKRAHQQMAAAFKNFDGGDDQLALAAPAEPSRGP